MYKQDDVTYIVKHNVSCPKCNSINIEEDKQQSCFNIDNGCVLCLYCKHCGYSFGVVYIIEELIK